jgi:hypothetical protein
MNQCTPDRFLHSRTHHTKGPACRGDWYGSSESGSPRIPRPAILRTDMSYLHSTFIQTHIHSHSGISWWKLWNWASQLLLTDDNGKCFHLSRVLMMPKLQKWWNVEEKFPWPNRDSNHGTLKWKSDALSSSPSEPPWDEKFVKGRNCFFNVS